MKYRSIQRDAKTVDESEQFLFSKGITNPRKYAEREKSTSPGGRPQYKFTTGGIFVPIVGSPIIVLGMNPYRAALHLQNNGTGNIYLGMDSQPSITAQNAIKLEPADFYSFSDGIVPTYSTIWAIAETAESYLSINEGVEIFF